MENARCTEDGRIYSATSFSCLPSVNLERMRRLLQCPECGGPAFFRSASFNGVRGSCFGARPHALGCTLAAFDSERKINGDEHEAIDLPNGKIIVDFNIGGSSYPPTGFRSGSDNYNVSEGFRQEAETHRRLRPLLRLLVESSEFRNSNQPIEVFDHSAIPVRDFFVPMLSVTEQHIGLCRGYWGLLSTVRIADDQQSIWFNSGGKDNLSFRLDIRFLPYFTNWYRVSDEEDFSGAYILVVGTLRSAPHKRFYCEIEELEFMALRLT